MSRHRFGVRLCSVAFRYPSCRSKSDAAASHAKTSGHCRLRANTKTRRRFWPARIDTIAPRSRVRSLNLLGRHRADQHQASCSSSALVASGHASAFTLSIAAASSTLRPSLPFLSRRRAACKPLELRRSSNGALSRNAYGRAYRISAASGDGSGKSRAIHESLRARCCARLVPIRRCPSLP